VGLSVWTQRPGRAPPLSAQIACHGTRCAGPCARMHTSICAHVHTRTCTYIQTLTCTHTHAHTPCAKQCVQCTTHARSGTHTRTNALTHSPLPPHGCGLLDAHALPPHTLPCNGNTSVWHMQRVLPSEAPPPTAAPHARAAPHKSSRRVAHAVHDGHAGRRAPYTTSAPLAPDMTPSPVRLTQPPHQCA